LVTALHRIEMFDDVGDIYFVVRDFSGGEQSLVEQFSNRSDELVASQVFLIAWSFADEHHLGTPFTEHRMGSVSHVRQLFAAFVSALSNR
jgi:hypothetical protein